MDLKILLGKRIREYRVRYNMTQAQLAEKLSIDDKHLSRIELGKNMPQAVVITKLAEVFGIEPKDLFDFYHLDNPENIKPRIYDILENLNDEQLLLAYKYLRTFVI